MCSISVHIYCYLGRCSIRLGRTLKVLDIKKKLRFGKNGEEFDSFMCQEDNTQSVKKAPKEETLRDH